MALALRPIALPARGLATEGAPGRPRDSLSGVGPPGEGVECGAEHLFGSGEVVAVGGLGFDEALLHREQRGEDRGGERAGCDGVVGQVGVAPAPCSTKVSALAWTAS
jgi:hypothetical protein